MPVSADFSRGGYPHLTRPARCVGGYGAATMAVGRVEDTEVGVYLGETGLMLLSFRAAKSSFLGIP